jgi:hypothetical protein
VHTFLLFFAWPDGAVWGNVGAMPVCGVIAAVFAFICRDRIGRALGGWWHRHLSHRAELDEIKDRLSVHADLLNPDTPGGLAAILSEVKDAKMAAESAHAAVKALAVVRPNPAPPWRRT